MRKREPVPAKFIDVRSIVNELNRRIDNKGQQSFASRHEILGVVTERYNNLSGNICSNDINKILADLTDLAIVSIWAIACVKAGTLDW